MTKVKEKIWLLIAIICAVCLTVFALSDIVTQPGHVLTAMFGDSAKNDFSYLYQCVYGRGFWFEGMNYPYGEHIVYADGQASLSVLFTCFKNVTPEKALAVMWLLIGLSYVLCMTFIYKILIHFKVTPFVAVIFACLIGIFSPQIFRITAHYGLSYTCVIPMLFYWTIKYNENKLKRYCVYIFLLGCVMAFFHPYFAALVLIWVLCYVAGYFVFTREKPIEKIRHVLPMLLSIISVVAIVAVIMQITDPIKDRPVTPYGILVYTTHKEDIYSSSCSPIWKYVNEKNVLRNVFTLISQFDSSEGYTYIGLAIVIALLYSFAAGVINKLRKNKERIIVNKEGFSPIWLFMAFTALLFGMGAPYKWNMEWLLNYVSFMRQFRSLGRFSWIFYYVITVYGVVVIHRLYANLVASHKSFLAYAVLLFFAGLWSFEASSYVKYLRGAAAGSRGNYDKFFSKGQQNWESFLQEHHYSKSDLQAILVLNFFHIGTDKLWVGDAGWGLTYGCEAGFQLHLPIVDQLMSRSSWSIAEKQVKIAAGPFVTKPMLNDIKTNKPFLLIRYDGDPVVDPDQQYLLQAADYIGHFSECEVYAFYPDRQISNDKKNADSINKILPFMKAADTCIVNKGEWYINHLDTLHAEDRLFGNGAMPRIAGDESNVAIIPVSPLKDSQLYEFSCWFLLSDKDCTSPCVFLESLDSAGNIIETAGMNTKWSVDNYKLWFRGSLYFHLRANCRAVRCRLSNMPNPSYKVMDEIMLRPADALIISKAADGSVMVNNHLFKKPALQAQKK